MINFRMPQFIFFLCTFPGATLLAQTTDAAEIASSSLWTMIEQGGWAMVPLGICSLTLIYLAIHCSRETKPVRFGSESLADRL